MTRPSPKLPIVLGGIVLRVRERTFVVLLPAAGLSEVFTGLSPSPPAVGFFFSINGVGPCIYLGLEERKGVRYWKIDMPIHVLPVGYEPIEKDPFVLTVSSVEFTGDGEQNWFDTEGDLE
jgi:hypothetical protein